MSRKTQVAYTHLFKYIHEHLIALDCHTFMTDYERAFRNALRSIYPDIVLIGNLLFSHLFKSVSNFDLYVFPYIFI